MNNRELVMQAMTELFVDKDPTAVDRWVAADYTQHNPQVPDGPAGLRGFLEALPERFGYELARVLVDGDLVAVHGVYRELEPGSQLVAFDIFRLRDGKLAEHWDALTPLVEHTVSGRSQVEGPTRIAHPEQTDQSHKIAAGFVETVLIGGHTEQIADYISTEQYHQHNPRAGDGLDGFGALLTTFAEQGITWSLTASSC
ncbi:nuclear transport factor 2 family protein [Nocardia sp. NBC_01499]|uniref:nuclear transport factor 2 family protein n=1 Tax=Nocardia sp. NBC_01499 TaxID=2903597 RepID=UPI003867B470